MDGSITLFCTILATIIAALTYYYTYIKPARENKKYLLERFDIFNKNITKLRTDLTDFAKSNNAFEEIFMQELTFQECINLLAKTQYELGGDDKLEILRKAKSSKNLENTLQGYENQIKHINEVQTIFDLYVKRAK